MEWLADVDTGAVINAVGLSGGWLLWVATVMALGYAFARRWFVTRGEYVEMRKDRDYYREALSLAERRADVASATVQRVLPTSERAVSVLETIQQMTVDQPLAIDRGETT